MTWITMIVFTHLEPDILECEVKWALGSITTNKASGGDGIPLALLGRWAGTSPDLHTPVFCHLSGPTGCVTGTHALHVRSRNLLFSPNRQSLGVSA